MDNGEFDLKSVLGALMNDSRVADTVQQLKESLSDSAPKSEISVQSNDTNQNEVSYPDLGALTKILSASETGKHNANDEMEKRNRLLGALKPYLRENRRDVVDKIMSISKLTGLFDLIPKDNS